MDYNQQAEYHLVTEDSSYSFVGSKVSEEYVKQLWKIQIDKPMSEITVIQVTQDESTKITCTKADVFTTPLPPNLDSYLILIAYKERNQFKETLSVELFRIFSYQYTITKNQKELVDFHNKIEGQAKSMGINVPKVIPNNSIYF